jgi:hypothetical protein
LFVIADQTGQRTSANVVWYAIATGLIAVGLLSYFVYFGRTGGHNGDNEEDSGYFSFPSFTWELRPRVKQYPLHTLLMDFSALAILSFVTGGAESVFLPLFVFGLLLGDVAWSERGHTANSIVTGRWSRFFQPLMFLGRNKYDIWILFLGTVFLATIPSAFEGVACRVGQFESPPCSESVWSLSKGWHTMASLVIFVPGSIFGSYVLREALRRRVARSQSSQQNASGTPKA